MTPYLSTSRPAACLKLPHNESACIPPLYLHAEYCEGDIAAQELLQEDE